MEKKAQIDFEVLTSLGFIILVAMALGATIIGWKMSMGMDGGGWPIWQILLIMAVEVVGCYIFAARG